jgi:cyclophilin family peptidyl-prolyl cis-trans isomerase
MTLPPPPARGKPPLAAADTIPVRSKRPTFPKESHMTLKVLAICFVCLAVMAAGSARAANPVVVMDTSMGTIKIELYEDKAPITVKNFLGYVEDKFYDGLVFHRIMDGFMIQGGGMEPGGKKKKTKDPIKNEAANGLKNQRGTIAMARTREPDTATSQFFINHGDNKGLDKENDPKGFGYCVFGRVIDGMDVVDKIAKVEVGPSEQGENSVPKKEITIKSVRLEKK